MTISLVAPTPAGRFLLTDGTILDATDGEVVSVTTHKIQELLNAGFYFPEGLSGLTASTAELNKLDGAGAAVASGTQASAITNASTAHALNSTFSDTEAEAALNALGTKINSILTALRAFGIVAS